MTVGTTYTEPFEYLLDVMSDYVELVERNSPVSMRFVALVYVRGELKFPIGTPSRLHRISIHIPASAFWTGR
jgi:hypothetical protein